MLLLWLYAVESARQRYLRAAANSEQFFRAAPTAMIVFDDRAYIQHINVAAAQMFGYSADELRGQPLSLLVSANLNAAQQQLLQYTLHPLGPISEVCKIEGRCRDETLFPLELRTKSISVGGRQWTVAAAHDLTADTELRHELERYVDQLLQSKNALQRYNTDLEGIVCEQTSQLKAAKEAAEQANAAKSDFLTNMSHELRTPLHAILSFARFGTKNYASATREKLLGYFQRIETSGQTLLKLLNALLDLSKLEARAMTIQCEMVELATLVAGVIDEFTAIAREKELTLRILNSEPGICVWADSERLGQVIRNLLGNSVKFVSPGGHIYVSLKTDRDSVILSVRDDGPGIPDDECERVFEKFVQSQRTRSGSGGTGLGLAICRQIVALHQGSIRALPTNGQGALMQLVLPLCRRQNDSSEVPSVTQQSETEEGQPCISTTEFLPSMITQTTC